MTKFSKRKIMHYFGAIFAEVRAKTNFLRKLDSVSYEINNVMNPPPPPKTPPKKQHQKIPEKSY